jgi:hypothetical protein
MDTLIAKYGLEVTMPDLRQLIAQCPRPGAPIHALRRVPDLKSGAARRRSHRMESGSPPLPLWC